MTPSNYHREYLATRVLAASPMELIRILYEGAVQAVDQAIIALRSGDILGRGNSVNKASEILAELQVSLRPGGPQDQYAKTLKELYGYMQHQLMLAHAEKSEKKMQEVSRLLSTLLEGWSGALTGKKSAASQEPERSPASPSSQGPYFLEPAMAGSQGRSWQV